MKYNEVKPCADLAPYIHSFWELKGGPISKWERIFPDGCPGIVTNLGEACETDNGLVTMEYRKTYVVGPMTSFKDSFIGPGTHLAGVCIKPAAFSCFYSYMPQYELTNNTVEFDSSFSFDADKLTKSPVTYFNRYFLDRIKNKNRLLQPVLADIHLSKGKLSIHEVSKRNFMTTRQMERDFKTQIGLSPKEYCNIIRFQSALAMISNSFNRKSLSEVAYECGYYDHAHLTNEIKRYAGLTPSQL